MRMPGEPTATLHIAVGPLEGLSALELALEVAKAMRHLHPDREFALFHSGRQIE